VALRPGVRQGLRPGVRPGVPLVDQVLAVGIVLNIALYLGTMASTEGAHEIAIVLPYAAALAGRMLGPSLLGGSTAIRAAGALVLCVYLAGLGYELTFPSPPPANSALAARSAPWRTPAKSTAARS
jgi:hypothetical protein